MTVERLNRDGLETVSVGFGRAEFVGCGEVGGEGGWGGAGAVRAGEVVGGDGDGGGYEEWGEAEGCAGVGSVWGLGTWLGRPAGGQICFEIVLDATFLWRGVSGWDEHGRVDGPRRTGPVLGHRRS